MSRPLHLLLAEAGARRPALPTGLDLDATDGEAPPSTAPPSHLASANAARSDVAAQGWGVVAPVGPRGDALLDAIAPLIEHRRAQVGDGFRLTRVPADLSATEAIAWTREHLDRPDAAARELPLYQLVLGDLHEVSPSVQEVLSSSFLTGRLAFDQLDDYAAYAAKVLRWTRSPSARARPDVLLHTVHDGTEATRAGFQGLITPALQHLEQERAHGNHRAAAVRGSGEPDDPRVRDLRDPASALEAGLLLSLSHGLGAPRGGWTSASHQRALQGALSFGDDGELTGEALRTGPFVPGGLWTLIACFGAGTPSTSAYHAWLSRLPPAVAGQAAQAALGNRPLPGATPFIAALPKAALANPDGPLGVIAHLDLAWTYSFEARIGSTVVRRHADYTRLITAAVGDQHGPHAPFGLAFDSLFEGFRAANNHLASQVQDRAAGLRSVLTDPSELGHLWMLRNDLGGYVLLGDPAARLPLAAPAPVTASAAQLFGFPFASPPPARPSRDAFERALAQHLLGTPVETLASELGLTPSALQAQFTSYLQGGRRALGYPS